jgi:hypothetical protein
MRVEDVGELTDLGYWRLVYDGCGHVQEFAHEGLDEPERAILYVKRQFARCLICASRNKPSGAEAIHLVLNAYEFATILIALRVTGQPTLADRFDVILRADSGPVGLWNR